MTTPYLSLKDPKVRAAREELFYLLEERFPTGCTKAMAFALFVTGLSQLRTEEGFDPHEVLKQVLIQLDR